MSDEKKPFAWVAPHQATQGVLPPGKDYVVTGWQVLGFDLLKGVFYLRKEDAEADASVINAAVERERREAVAKELRSLADAADPIITLSDETVMAVDADWLRARAAKIERGEQ